VPLTLDLPKTPPRSTFSFQAKRSRSPQTF
jgi:hypothetical protein